MEVFCKTETKGRPATRKTRPASRLSDQAPPSLGVTERMFLDDKTSVLPLARKEAGWKGGSLPSCSLQKHSEEPLSAFPQNGRHPPGRTCTGGSQPRAPRGPGNHHLHERGSLVDENVPSCHLRTGNRQARAPAALGKF